MPSVADFLSRGYFPRELPPCFGTTSYAAAISMAGAPPSDTPHKAKLCIHNLARPGSLRRKLAIPNPIQFHRLVEGLVNNWTAIAAHIDASPVSMSKPTSTQVTRAIVPADMFDQMQQASLKVRSLAPFVVRTDVNQFYGSLYSHSLPWALHGKATAKATRGPSLFGNVLDECVRNMQDGQTIGIPVGPDTSLVLAEIILSAVDQELSAGVPARLACRQVDDFEIGAADRASADRLLGTLQQLLNGFELVLNPKKTQIIEPPTPFAASWVHAIRRFRFRTRRVSQRFDLLAFYDLAFRSAIENPDGAVIKYSVSRLRPIHIHPDNWDMHEGFLHQAMLAEPGVAPEAVSQLIRFEALGMTIDAASLGAVVNRLIVAHAPQGHGNDVAWALWTALAFAICLSKEATSAAEGMDDSVVALLLLDAEAQGLLPRAIPPTRWEDFMTAPELYEEQWLLSYEGALHGWRSTKGGGDHIADDANFAWMRTNAVSFYEQVSPPAPPPVPHIAWLMAQDTLGFSTT